MAGEVLTHFKVGGAYATINEWVAANQGDLVTALISPVLVCHESKAGHQEQAVISGSTTSADYHMKIRAATAVEALAEGENEAESLGIKKRGFWMKSVNNGTGIRIQDNYGRVSQIGVGIVATYGNRYGIEVDATESSDTYIKLDQNVYWVESGTPDASAGVRTTYNGRANVNVSSSLFMGLTNGFQSDSGGSTQTMDVLNNVFADCDYAYLQYYSGTQLNFHNNAVFNCIDGWNPNDFSGNDLSSVSANNNATNLVTPPANWASTVTGLTSGDFVDSANGDYHTDSGSINLIQTGLDVSAYDVVYDCDGQTWTAPYGIGYDQPGEITFTADININCLDAETLSAIEGVGVYVYAAAGGDLTAGDEMGAGATDSLGQLSLTVDYTTDQPYVAQGRKGSSSPYYQEGKSIGLHQLTGSTVNIYMISDED